MHKLDEKTMITPAMLRRLHAEAVHADGNGSFFAVFIKSDGSYVGHSVGPDALPEQVLFARDIVHFLNHALHHDGAWYVVFTNPGPLSPLAPEVGVLYRRFVMLWMDADGDTRIPVENDEDFYAVLAAGPLPWLQQAEVAWTLWRRSQDVLDLEERETFKRAKGEQAPSTLH